MQKNKTIRSMGAVGQSQYATEKTTQDKFKLTEDLAIPSIKTSLKNPISSSGRISPQISCTITAEDKQLLNDITMFAINKAGRPLNTSTIIRALIQLGHSRQEELEF